MSGGMDVVTSPASTPSGEPLSAFYHSSPDHCTSSMAAINRMRQNAQVRHEKGKSLLQKSHMTIGIRSK